MPSVVRHAAPPPSTLERYCAWYGDRGDPDSPDAGIFYFGQAAFWSSARRAGGDPSADLEAAGPQQIGRFDLATERHLTPLDVAVRAQPKPGEHRGRSGVWDVLPRPNGRAYFTTFFEHAGSVDTATGEVEIYWLGPMLGELAPGPPGLIVAARYAGASGGRAGGAAVLFDEEGRLVAEHRLGAHSAGALAPKTVAYDSSRNAIWLTTDVLGGDASDRNAPAQEHNGAHPTLVIDATTGAELARIDSPEIQFVRFDGKGRGFAVLLRRDGALELAQIAPGPQPRLGQRWLLEPRFAAAFDFAQDLSFGPSGEVVVTRWSGVIHVLDTSGQLRRVELPGYADGGLYYSASLRGGRVCATYCEDVSVVCADLPPPAETAPALR